jgi:hypothetical protein
MPGRPLLRALATVTPDALKTLQDEELEQMIVLLAEVNGSISPFARWRTARAGR